MSSIRFTVYKQYFDAIKNGSKKTEYREIKPYWIKKLVDMSKYPNMTEEEIKDAIVNKGATFYPRTYDECLFFCGKESLKIQFKGINVYKGYSIFAIKLGKIIK